MHDARSTVVVEAQLLQEAATPCPTSNDRVNQRRHYEREKNVCVQECAFCKRTRDGSACRRAETKVNHPPPIVDVLEVLVKKPSRAHKSPVIPVRVAITHEVKGQGAHQDVDQVLVDDVAAVLGPDATHLEHHEAELHTQDMYHDDQHPQVVDGFVYLGNHQGDLSIVHKLRGNGKTTDGGVICVAVRISCH